MSDNIDTHGPVGICTIDAAAEYLGIPKATLYTWRTRRPGYGPRAIKAGGSLRYRLCDLESWLLEHLENIDGDLTETSSSEGPSQAQAPHPGASQGSRSA